MVLTITKRWRLTECILKWHPIICWLQETYLSDNIWLKVQRQKILLQGNGIWKKIVATAVIPDEADIESKLVKEMKKVIVYW